MKLILHRLTLIHEIYFLQFGPTLSRVNLLSKDLAADVSMQIRAVRLVSPTFFSLHLVGQKAKAIKHFSFSNIRWNLKLLSVLINVSR